MYSVGLTEFNGERSQPPNKFNRSTSVFVSTCILAICSIVTTAIAASLFPGHESQYSTSVGVCQGLALVVSSTSFLYIGFYLIAARKNEEVGTVRPPVRKVHAVCFITIRISAVLWLCSMIASLAISFKKGICSKSSLICSLEKLDVAISITAFLSSTTILWCLKTSTHPFKTPKSLHIRSKASYRASILDDLLDRSVSRAFNHEHCTLDYEKRYIELEAYAKECTTILTTHPSLQKKLSLKFPVSSSQIQRIPGAFPSDISISKRSSDSSLSIWSGTSGFSGYSGTTYINPQRLRRARPTSSISSSTRRSPVSTMRYADFPNIVIKPDLRYATPSNIPVPPIPPAYQGNLSQPQSQPQPQYHRHVIYHNLPLPLPGYIGPAPLLPVANPPYNARYMLNRRPSAMVRTLEVRKVLPGNLRIISPIQPPKLKRKNTANIKVPGAFKIKVEIGDENKVEEFERDVGECHVPGAFSVEEGEEGEEGEEVEPVFGKKIETFFDKGRATAGAKSRGDGSCEKDGKRIGGGAGNSWRV